MFEKGLCNEPKERTILLKSASVAEFQGILNVYFGLAKLDMVLKNVTSAVIKGSLIFL